MRWGAIAAGLLFVEISAFAQTPPPPEPPATPPAANLPPADAPVPMPAPADMANGNAAPPKWVDTHQGPDNIAWLNANYRFLRIKDGPQPLPLAISGTGAVLVGGSDLDFGTFNAAGGELGLWINDCHTFGVYAGGFLTEQRSVVSAVASNSGGSPTILRPFTDALTASPRALLVSSPGALAGGLVSDADARLAGTMAGLVWNLFQTESYTINTLAGFRYLDLDENLSVVQRTQRLSTLAPVAPLVIEDRFHTRNQFYGGQIGTSIEYRMGSLSVSGSYKVSLGPNHEVVEIIGNTTGVGPADAISGGLLALPGGNAGRETKNRFVVVPEVGGQLGWQATNWLRLIVGYDFLYINDVARPGSQIDPFINQKLVPVSPAFGSTSGPNSPMRTERSDTFYAHGVQFGCEIKY